MPVNASQFANGLAAAPPRAPVPTRTALTNPSLAFQNSVASPAPQETAGGTAQPFAYAPAPPAPPVAQNPGLDMNSPGLSEQTFNSTQNRLNEDPFQSTFQSVTGQAGTPSAGETYLNQNLGSLNGPGQGEQYWNQVQGQFQNPMAGEQFARQSTAGFSPNGQAGSFFDNAMGQYDQFTSFQGPQAGAGQYSQNAASGPLAGQSFYDSVAGQAGTTGRYSDPNLAAGQYANTQQAFGDLPIANFDPFYDRASQLGVQKYNQQAGGRGVYGSSEALSGVGNVITDIEAQRANRSFDAEMQREQANQGRQTILGNQARAGDLSSLSGFAANLSGLETFGNLAGQAGQQTLGQQTMLGNQAAQTDQSAQAAQNSNIAGVNAFGDLAGNADTASTNRFQAANQAMNAADRTAIDRGRLGGDLSSQVDTTNRQNFDSQNQAATSSGNLQNNRQNTQIQAASSGSAADLNRLNSLNNQAQGAENDRQRRVIAGLDEIFKRDSKVADLIGKGIEGLNEQGQADYENFKSQQLAPIINDANLSSEEKQRRVAAAIAGFKTLNS